MYHVILQNILELFTFPSLFEFWWTTDVSTKKREDFSLYICRIFTLSFHHLKSERHWIWIKIMDWRYFGVLKMSFKMFTKFAWLLVFFNNRETCLQARFKLLEFYKKLMRSFSVHICFLKGFLLTCKIIQNLIFKTFAVKFWSNFFFQFKIFDESPTILLLSMFFQLFSSFFPVFKFSSFF